MSRLARFRHNYLQIGTFPFYLVHAVAIAGIIHYGWSWSGFALAMIFYGVRMFFLTAAFHRYFSHRTYKTSRPFQFILAIFAQTCAQRGALWWSANHRAHHKYSDMPQDIHSAKQKGFWWSHMGWFLSNDHHGTDLGKIADFAKYPELRFMDTPNMMLMPAVVLALAIGFIGGIHALLWGFFVSTTLLWHGTFTINSLSHLIGTRRYATTDDSKNNLVLALITCGEGWHNNHHHYQSATRQGFFWWEIDFTWYGLKLFEALGLVWDLRKPPQHVLDNVIDPAEAGLAISDREIASPPPDTALPPPAL